MVALRAETRSSFLTKHCVTIKYIYICVTKQQMRQLFIQFINHVWFLQFLLHVSALHCHPHHRN
jgi:hypothetical protein